MNNREGFYNVSIHPRSLKCYWEPYERKCRAGFAKMYDLLPKSNKSGGLISFKAQKRINIAIDWMLAQSVDKKYYSKKYKKHYQFRVNFLTLTLSAPQVHSDNMIKSGMLNNFLTQLRQKWNVHNYLWRAEAQLNGNIHFHIATDRFIPWWEIRHTWNKIQDNFGYIDRFEDKHGHRDPNSTDIHKVKKIRNLGGYLSKEISKNSKGLMYTAIRINNGTVEPCFNPSLIEDIPTPDQGLYRTIEGNLWGLSTSLSRVRAHVMVIAGKVQEEMQQIGAFFKNDTFSTDWFFVINASVKAWALIVKGELWKEYQLHLQELRTGQTTQLTIPV